MEEVSPNIMQSNFLALGFHAESPEGFFGRGKRPSTPTLAGSCLSLGQRRRKPPSCHPESPTPFVPPYLGPQQHRQEKSGERGWGAHVGRLVVPGALGRSLSRAASVPSFPHAMCLCLGRSSNPPGPALTDSTCVGALLGPGRGTRVGGWRGLPSSPAHTALGKGDLTHAQPDPRESPPSHAAPYTRNQRMGQSASSGKEGGVPLLCLQVGKFLEICELWGGEGHQWCD